jgi:hypothetical protein
MKRPVYIHDPSKQYTLRDATTSELLEELARRQDSILVEAFEKMDVTAQVVEWLNDEGRWAGRGDELAVYRKCWESYGPLIVDDLWDCAIYLYQTNQPAFDKVENSRITEAFENTINYYKIREWK